MDRFAMQKKLLTSEFDYFYLVDMLKDYHAPRDQITRFLRNGWITRIKKGIYVLGPDFGRPYSKFVLANMIYGPSYVSGHSALAYYGAIPERVDLMESETPNRNKEFTTPAGKFLYSYVNLKRYVHGIQRVQLDDRRAFLIATPEKALLGVVSRQKNIESSEDLTEYLASLRIDSEFLSKLKMKNLKILESVFERKLLKWLEETIRNRKLL